MSRLADFLRRRFGYSHSEILGLTLLIPIVVVVILLPIGYEYALRQIQPESLSDEKQLLEEWKKEIRLVPNDSPETKSLPIIKRFFDPNKISSREFVALGFDSRVAERIVKYRTRGGQFRNTNDLLKIYGIDSALILAYEEYIIYPKESIPRSTTSNHAPQDFQQPKPRTEEKIIVPLNSADTADFRKIRGIGKYWSARIVKYREALGGFVSKKQLHEMYGLSPDLVDILDKHTMLDKIAIRKINLNQSSVKELSSHPYMNHKAAQAIVQYRTQHGHYQSLDDLSKIVALPDSLIVKIQPYLRID